MISQTLRMGLAVSLIASASTREVDAKDSQSTNVLRADLGKVPEIHPKLVDFKNIDQKKLRYASVALIRLQEQPDLEIGFIKEISLLNQMAESKQSAPKSSAKVDGLLLYLQKLEKLAEQSRLEELEKLVQKSSAIIHISEYIDPSIEKYDEIPRETKIFLSRTLGFAQAEEDLKGIMRVYKRADDLVKFIRSSKKDKK